MAFEQRWTCEAKARRWTFLSFGFSRSFSGADVIIENFAENYFPTRAWQRLSPYKASAGTKDCDLLSLFQVVSRGKGGRLNMISQSPRMAVAGQRQYRQARVVKIIFYAINCCSSAAFVRANLGRNLANHNQSIWFEFSEFLWFLLPVQHANWWSELRRWRMESIMCSSGDISRCGGRLASINLIGDGFDGKRGSWPWDYVKRCTISFPRNVRKLRARNDSNLNTISAVPSLRGEFCCEGTMEDRTSNVCFSPPLRRFCSVLVYLISWKRNVMSCYRIASYNCSRTVVDI